MKVVLVSGEEEGNEIPIPEGLVELEELVGYRIEGLTYRFENRLFIKGSDLQVRGKPLNGWTEVEDQMLVNGRGTLMLFKTQ